MERLDELEREVQEKLNTEQNQTLVSVDEQTAISMHNGVGETISEVKQKIMQKAADKIQDDRIIERHSENIAKISDRALEVETEKQRLIVEQVNADNKVVEQEIKNRLIVLKAEAKRLLAEQKQLDKEQKAEHKKRNKDAKWQMYGEKLTKMKYNYVPNPFVLGMLLFFDGVKGFFDGVGSVSTSIVKAFKWILLFGVAVGTLMAIPVTREWLLTLLQFK